MAYISISRGFTASLSERFDEMVKSIRLTLHRRRVFKQTQRELNALSSRELADLGIHRTMITRIALEAAYGK
ncbi:DUF1127 domain-containing protein [Szabonella alba]|uniref:DUF1127 domain-containing protein n=1 Tax=Szabonella alba TaxID=2804194 RepID=A0A8K0XZN3_9RHOB|nr:DUF1127 domain-containing protein [Szabonella alba]MBL4916233.1 DUF1127 domain-containing protein [Szabonella alba]